MKKIILTVLVITALLFSSSCMWITGAENTTSMTVLKPTIELSAVSLKPGETLTVTIGEWNSLAENVKAPAANKWPLTRLTVGPCGTINYPMGMAFYAGYYDESNVPSAEALQFFDPNAGYHCPAILSGISYYLFKPGGNTADVFVEYLAKPVFNDWKVSMFIFIKGFWSDGVYQDFTPGIYTIACGDEWGNLTLAHFTVLGE